MSAGVEARRGPLAPRAARAENEFRIFPPDFFNHARLFTERIISGTDDRFTGHRCLGRSSSFHHKGSHMAAPVRMPITNVLLGSDYSGKFYIGAQQKEVNLLLDTGSSTIAVESASYDPQKDSKAVLTTMAQEVSYGDGSGWVGSVVQTDVAVKSAAGSLDLPGVAVAVAYHETSGQMFGNAQGILGLAFAPLDTAYILKKTTVPPHYTPNDFRSSHRTQIEPYFTQLAKAGLAAGRYAFYTRRSVIRASANPASDPLNNGWLILGGGEEATDLYTGTFQAAAVLSDDWYSVNLKSVSVGSGSAIPVAPPSFQSSVPTNAIVDSGTNSLYLTPVVYDAILAKLPAAQRNLVKHGGASASSIELSQWPALTFVLQGMPGDITLTVKPENYWQLDAGEVGQAQCVLLRGDSNDMQSILGLPLMNNYFTVFDDTANNGLGVVKFAAIK
jgi:hypothetical protein